MPGGTTTTPRSRIWESESGLNQLNSHTPVGSLQGTHGLPPGKQYSVGEQGWPAGGRGGGGAGGLDVVWSLLPRAHCPGTRARPTNSAAPARWVMALCLGVFVSQSRLLQGGS